jgi:hypothetical protein
MAHRRSLGFARDDKGGGGASIWDRLLGSQVSNARPGAPFDFTLRHCGEHKLCHFSPDSLSASRLLLGMTRRELGFTGNWLHGFQVSNGAEPGGIAYSRSLSRATCVRR